MTGIPNKVSTMKDKKDKKVSFSKTVERNGNRKTIRVEEVENGFIITIEKFQNDEWMEKRYISTENPMHKTDNVSPDESIMKEARFGDFLDV
jgi:hypothetical protein